MSRRTRMAAFVASSLALVAAATASLLVGRPSGPPSVGAGAGAGDVAPKTVIVAETPIPTATPAPSPGTPVARRFVRAFLRYEVGDAPPAVVRALRASASRTLAHDLLVQPARPAAGQDAPPPGRLVRIDPGGSERRVVAVLDYAGRRGALTLTLTRSGRRWAVARVG